MDFKNVQTLKYPAPLVWATMRDHLPHIVSAQDDMDYVQVEKRSNKKPNAVHIISTWKADPPLPGFLKNFIKPDMLVWTDDAVWDNDTTTCTFDITTHYKVEDIDCTGTIQVEAAGSKSSKITYSGVLTISKTERSSIFLSGFIIRGIESLASTLIAHNFGKVVKALGETIAKKK